MKRFIALNLLCGCLVALFSGILPPRASQAAELLALQDVPSTIRLVPLMADPNPNYNHVMGEKKISAFSNMEALSSTFTINYLPSGADPHDAGDNCTVWPSAVQSAFSAAVNIWASKLTSSVPIVIDACWATNMDSGVLGHAGAVNFHKDFTNAPKPGTYYQASLANSLAGRRLGTNSADIYMAFSRDYNWYFGTDGNPPTSLYDFVSVVAHEIGHGLGFSGSMEVSYGQGSWGIGTGYPTAYDQFTVDNSNQQLINTMDYPNPSTILGSALTSGGIYFNGTNSSAANGGTKVKLYAPSTWVGGSSYSHLDYDTYKDTANALMVYSLSSGRAIHDQGPVTMGLFKDLGWQVSSASTAPPAAPTMGTATAGNGSAIVSFTPPTSNGGSTITSYTVTSSPGNITNSGSSSPITVTGLTNNTTYTFTVKATNAAGTGPASAASNSVTPSSGSGGGTTNLLLNPDFESGVINWDQASTSGYGVIFNEAGIGHNGSNWYAWLGGIPNATDKLFQNLTIPANATSALLDFYAYIYSDEGTTAAYDYLNVYVADPPTSTELVSLGYLSNKNQASSWQHIENVDLSTYKGRTIGLYFVATNNINLTTNFYIDDVSLAVTSPGPTTFSVTPTAGANGGISPNSVQSVNGGSTISFTVSPDPGYQLFSITGCGGTLSGSTYTTGPINGDCSVTASFSLISAMSHDGVVIAASGKTTPDISDALAVLKHVVGLITLSEAQLIHGDVAPLGSSGAPQGDGIVNISDALGILRRCVGLAGW